MWILLEREKRCIFLGRSLSSMSIVPAAFLLVTDISCYDQHCCRLVNVCVTFQNQGFQFSYPFFLFPGAGTKRNRKRECECLMSLMAIKTIFSSLFYCCNLYDILNVCWLKFTKLQENFDNVPGCC